MRDNVVDADNLSIGSRDMAAFNDQARYRAGDGPVFRAGEGALSEVIERRPGVGLSGGSGIISQVFTKPHACVYVVFRTHAC